MPEVSVETWSASHSSDERASVLLMLMEPRLLIVFASVRLVLELVLPVRGPRTRALRHPSSRAPRGVVTAAPAAATVA